MSHDCVVAVFADMQQFSEGVELLLAEEISRDQISVVSRSLEHESPEAAEEAQLGDEAETKTARGATAGSLLGAVAGASLLFIPGIGPLIATGAFAGALTGGLVGGYLGSMQGWGVHEDHVQAYDKAVREGKVVVVIHGNPLLLARAVRVLQGKTVRVHLHAAESGDEPELIAETNMKKL